MSGKTYPVTAEQLDFLREMNSQLVGLVDILNESDKFHHILNVLEPISYGLLNTLNRMPRPSQKDDEPEPETKPQAADYPTHTMTDYQFMRFRELVHAIDSLRSMLETGGGRVKDEIEFVLRPIAFAFADLKNELEGEEGGAE